MLEATNKDKSDDQSSLPFGSYWGTLVGDLVIIHDARQSRVLHGRHCFGSFLEGHHRGAVQLKCFEGGGDDSKDDVGRRKRVSKWQNMLLVDVQLRLSMEESMYLQSEMRILRICLDNQTLSTLELWKYFVERHAMQFVRRYVTYRHYRKMGWTVVSGLTYGCDFVLYRNGPQCNHSYASVLIEKSTELKNASNSTTKSILCYNRFLRNLKKLFIRVHIDIPKDTFIQQFHCLNSLSVQEFISVPLTL